MRSLHSRFGSFAIVVAAIAVGCQATGDGEVTKDERIDQTPNDSVPLPPSGKDAAEPSSDGASDSGATDGGTPNPGDPCSKIGAAWQRPCGKCGTQEATCVVPGVVSPYGPCSGEGGTCLPGATEKCGNCGTRTCNPTCTWSFKCAEPPNACPAGISEYSNVGCAVPGTYKKRTCDALCAWGPLGACLDANPNKMIISNAVGGIVSAGWTVADGDLGKRVNGTCGVAATVTPDATYNRVRVEISNPTAQAAQVSIYQSKAQGFAEMDMVMWVYNGTLPPADDAALTACAYGVADDCIAGNPCGNPNTFVFAGMSNVVIPANGKVLVYNTGYVPPIQGPFVLNVRTDGFL